MTGERFCGEMRNLSGLEAESPLGETDYAGACKSTSFGDYKTRPVDTPQGPGYPEWDTGAHV